MYREKTKNANAIFGRNTDKKKNLVSTSVTDLELLLKRMIDFSSSSFDNRMVSV